MQLHKRGICPRCVAPGIVGQPCESGACARRGYHAVPPENVEGEAGQALDGQVGRMVGKYLLTAVLGGGNFGKVYAALQQPIGKPAALKLIHHEGGATPADLEARFEAEARALARVAHPNVVQLLDYGFHDGAPYMVMELVTGAATLKHELRQRAAAGRQLEVDEVRTILTQVLDGLGAAHDAGIVHRDMKPENMMLVAVRGQPLFVKLLDFGLAKDVSLGNETAAAIGTPAYMAPEQLIRRGIGAWTDLYAVTVIAFELMTGKRVFVGSLESIVSQKMNPDRDPLETLKGVPLPATVRRFLATGLARAPEDRFQHVDTMRPALVEALDALEGTAATIDVTGLVSAAPSTETYWPRAVFAKSAPRRSRLAPWAVAGGVALALIGVGVLASHGGDDEPRVAMTHGATVEADPRVTEAPKAAPPAAGAASAATKAAATAPGAEAVVTAPAREPVVVTAPASEPRVAPTPASEPVLARGSLRLWGGAAVPATWDQGIKLGARISDANIGLELASDIVIAGCGARLPPHPRAWEGYLVACVDAEFAGEASPCAQRTIALALRVDGVAVEGGVRLTNPRCAY